MPHGDGTQNEKLDYPFPDLSFQERPWGFMGLNLRQMRMPEPKREA